jgi:DNA-binding winged helix-turn-helix (wHTH) protein/tetratricopeptide (TPR) repeat protein
MLLPDNDVYRFDEFELDPSRRALARNNAHVPLSPKAFDLLMFLVLNPGRVITKEELLKAVWPDSFVEEGNLAQYISWVRKALGDRSACIATISGRGYQFTAKVQVEHSVDALPESQPGDIFVQRVRERTHVVIEQSSPAPVALALPAWTPNRRNTAIRWASLSLLAAALIAVAATVAWKRLVPPPQLRKVVVADFANSTGDAAFDRTLKRALEIDLEQSPYIDVMSESEAASILQLMGRGNTPEITPGIAREVCERSNRQVLLTASIAPVGRDYLLTLEATDCASGKQLAGAKAEASTKEKVLAALDSVADHVRKGLGESTASLQSYQVPIMTATTPSLDALKSYSVGLYLAAQGKGEAETLPFYQKAVALDPGFAMAYGAIASDYYNLNEYNLASQYYRKAFELSGSVSAKEKLEIQAHFYCEGQEDLLQGMQVYSIWAETYPHDWVPWVNLTNEYTQLGKYAPAISAGRRAIQEAPDRGISYSVLVRAYKRANHFADAKAVAQQAVQKGKDSSGLHASLLQIAFAENDRDAFSREIKWGEDHGGGWFFLVIQADAAATAGSYRKAEEMFRDAVEAAERDNLPETASDILLDQAQTEFELGLDASSRATIRRVGNSEEDSPDLAFLHAELGDASSAERYLAAHNSSTHPGTQMAFVNLPRIQAALAMRRGKPLDAITALGPAIPYELADYTVPSQLGAAYLQAGQPEFAGHEYRKILLNRGVDPVSVLYPLAHLGMARAYALEKDTRRSRKEYDEFFALWKDGDSDIPILKQARIEYSRLR